MEVEILSSPGNMVARHTRKPMPEDAIRDAAIRAGRPVILCDDEDRENQGDMIFATQFSTPPLVNAMIRQCGGLICVALAQRAGLVPAAAICEILDDSGEAMLRDALFTFAERNAILVGTVAALADWSGA